MAEFLPAVELVLSHEGGFSDDPLDKGLATNMGVSLRFYRKYINPKFSVEDIKRLTKDEVISIYYQYFWNKQPYCDINNQKLCNRVFDLSVNCGPSYAVAMLQRAYNSFNAQHLQVDGQLGPKTIAALNSEADQDRLYNELISQATHYYEELADHGQNHRFYNGWINRLHN